MATSIVVCGAAGRMGRTLIGLIAQNPAVRLAGAVEAAGNPTLGKDAGDVAGVGSLGVVIQSDFQALASPDRVALDFTSAEAAVTHLRLAVQQQSPIVIGATGFTPALQAELDELAPRTRCVVAPNMSVGIAVLQRLVREAARALGEEFDPEIVEMHHRMKVDAPSGTALALARTVADATGRELTRDAVYGREGLVGKRRAGELGVLALRGGDVVGDHRVLLLGEGERLELGHVAGSRLTFARGALAAARWVVGREPGLYGIREVLGLGG